MECTITPDYQNPTAGGYVNFGTNGNVWNPTITAAAAEWLAENLPEQSITVTGQKPKPSNPPPPPQQIPCATGVACYAQLPQTVPQNPLCGNKLPGGSTVNQNVAQTRASLFQGSPIAPVPFLAMIQWIENVAPNGAWDYKTSGQPGSEQMGNFNYGATGSVFFSPLMLKSAAGIVQLLTLPSNSSGGIPFLLPPYGDEAGDQADIQAGITAGCGGS